MSYARDGESNPIETVAGRERSSLRKRLKWNLRALGVRLTGLVLLLSFTTTGALAQGDVTSEGQAFFESVVCGTMIHNIFIVVLAAAMSFFAIKGLWRGVSGLDDLGSADPQTAQEGREELQGAAMSLGAAALVPVGIGALEFFSIPIATCLI